MEETNQEIGENRLPVSLAQAEAATLDIIRTETVLSRLPVHNLAKKGSISISILKKTDSGEVELLWKVSPNRDHGEPRQLAYKLDTIIINQRIDEARRPLPKMLRLGSLNEICNELGISKQGGKSKNEVKRAFFQNVGALITAKFTYKANDGTERRLEAAFTRYSVIFTGEKLPDGRKADAVYIILNEPFWEVLNNAPVRPLDRAYMKELPPAAQRFYEIVSRKIFAALKNHYPYAKIAYSEYCTFSAQLRHLERQRVQDQMAKVIRHHKESGYITAVKYEPTIDAENRPDWIMYLTPGPKAHAEFRAVHGRKPKAINAGSEKGDSEPMRRRSAPRERQVSAVSTTAAQSTFDPQLVAEFTRRGITKKKAQELLQSLKPNQDAIAQLEFGEHIVQHSRIPIMNPAGFLIRLVQSNTSIPENFETNARRKAREEKEREERERRAAEDTRQLLESEYHEYRQQEVDQYIEQNPTTFEALKEAKWNEHRAQYSFSPDMITSMAKHGARQEIEKQVPVLTLEEFVERKRQGTDFSLKPVAVPRDAAIEPAPPESEDLTATGESAEVPPSAVVVPETEAAAQSAINPATEPAMPEPPMIELVSEPPPLPNDNVAEQGMA